MVAPLQCDMKKDVKNQGEFIAELEDALVALAQQVYVMQFHIEQMEQNIHDLELKMEYKYGKHCINASL